MFYLDGQPITAKSIEQLHPRRDTVHRLELESGSFRHTIPPSVTTVIVKQQKDGWEEEFGLEKEAYERLDKLQGIAIPELYGQGSFNGLPALILSDVAGTTLYDLARSKTEIEDEILENELKIALKELHEHGAEHWDQKMDNFLFCDNGKVMVVDLEDVRFPDKRGPWEDSVNLGGVYHLMSDFRYVKDPNRPSSPLSFWMTGPEEWGAFGTTRPCGPAQLMKRGNVEEQKSMASTDARKEGTEETRVRRASEDRLKVSKHPKNRRVKRTSRYWTRLMGGRIKSNLGLAYLGAST